MASGAKGSGNEGRARVRWSPRGRRRWCPGAARSSAAAQAQVPTGWTSYLHWQGMLDALRGRRVHEIAAGEAAQARPQSAVDGAEPSRPEPRAALPDRRQRSPSEAPAVDGWLDGTPD